MYVIAACGNGMGTSMIIKIKLQKIFKELNIDAKIDAMSSGQAKGNEVNADIIICSKYLVDQFRTDKKAKIVGVVNLMDEKEISIAIKKCL